MGADLPLRREELPPRDRAGKEKAPAVGLFLSSGQIFRCPEQKRAVTKKRSEDFHYARARCHLPGIPPFLAAFFKCATVQNQE